MRILHAWGFPASLNSRKSVKFSNDDAHIIEHIIFPPFWFNVVPIHDGGKGTRLFKKFIVYTNFFLSFFFLIKERRINRIVILLLFYHRLNTNVKYRNEDLLILLIKTRFTRSSRLRVFKKRETMHKHRLINLYHREIPAFPILSDSTLFLFQYNSNFCKLENPSFFSPSFLSTNARLNGPNSFRVRIFSP